MNRPAAVPACWILPDACRAALRFLCQRLAPSALLCAALSGACVAAPSPFSGAQNLVDLSLEDLRNVVVSSVSRHDQPLQSAAASVYVITGDEIRRLGVTTLPEALRLAPNLEVAALDARQYAISARGFNINGANKLLVIMDGRTVYSPLFSGTFWDSQDFVPSDIDRIEVISGPAGATWGTNAVNGVINIITLPAAQSTGTVISASAGSHEKTAWARWGGLVSDDLAFRASVKTFDRGPTRLQGGVDANDAARGTSVGLRADWSRSHDTVMLDAHAYTGNTDARPTYGAVEVSGVHLLGKWSRQLSEKSDFDLQAYFDRSNRADRFLLQDNASIFDVEGKFRFRAERHDLLFGAGYRRAQDQAAPGLLFAFLPPERNHAYYSAFVQDEWTLGKGLVMTLGNRFERNPYSGWEVLPSVRLGYAVEQNVYLWTALSRAVRSPARLDRELYFPAQPPFQLVGGPGFKSETANIFELGYRAQPSKALSWSVTAFVQDYESLRSVQMVNSQYVIDNKSAGHTRGLEAWGQWQLTSSWRLNGGLMYLDKRVHLNADSNDPNGTRNQGNDPHLQGSLRSTHSLSHKADLVVAVRHVGRLPQPLVPAYTAVDAQFNWRPRPDVGLSLGVRNALDRRHVEFDSGAFTGEIPRSAFVAVTFNL